MAKFLTMGAYLTLSFKIMFSSVILDYNYNFSNSPAKDSFTGKSPWQMTVFPSPPWRVYISLGINWLSVGVTLAQLVKASVGQADVQRFGPHLGHNWLSCGVFLVKSRHFGLPLTQTIRPNWQSLLVGGSVARYKRGVFTKSVPEETRTITVPSLSGL